MHLSRISIENFRNFSALDIELAGNVVVVGENRVGKSNLLYALRLIFDPALPDSARMLGLADFWDGIEEPGTDTKIVVSVDIRAFEDDMDVLALLTDFRLDDDPQTARLTYEFRPKPDLEHNPGAAEDYEFICYGGESEAKEFGYRLRQRIGLDVLPALRDAEGDLAVWRRSPLRPLIEDAFRDIDRDELKEIAQAIGEVTGKIKEFDEIKKLEGSIGKLFASMSGPRQDVKPRLGFSPVDPTRLYRSVQLLIDSGERSIGDASLGSANLVFLTLKTLAINKMIEDNARDHTFLAIEEPEAHLHPHLQRSVYRKVFETIDADTPLSVFLTTHSPHIASVAPLRSILLLKDTPDRGTVGRSTAALKLTEVEVDDLARYLDVTRAELLFARGVILVEGDAERFLIPAFAQTMNTPLDHLGITVCSVAGTNFVPYVKLLSGLGIPFSVVTDWDPRPGKAKPLGFSRSIRIVAEMERIATGNAPDELVNALKAMNDYNAFANECEAHGVFTNTKTLEVDLFEDGFAEAVIAALRDHPLSAERKALLVEWENDPAALDEEKYLALIEAIGKGRFAQRLVAHIGDEQPPAYIRAAVRFVADRV